MPKIVMVIGAGSSIDLGGGAFMSGEGLLERIQSLLRGSNRARNDDTQYFLEVAARHLGKSGLSRFSTASETILRVIGTFDSIDQLISHVGVEDVTRVAKMCIALIISQSEVTSRIGSNLLSTTATRAKWLPRFLRGYLENCRTLSEAISKLKDVGFVVFNYDRLVEQVVFAVLRDRFQATTSSVLGSMKDLDIVHPYGSLGALDLDRFRQNRGARNDAFLHDFATRCGELAEGLKTFGEGRDDAIHKRVQDIVDSCKSLIFVGFGFGDANLDLICPENNTGSIKSFYATTTKISDRRWQSLESRTLGRMSRSASSERETTLRTLYDRGRINRAQSCDDLVTDYGLEW